MRITSTAAAALTGTRPLSPLSVLSLTLHRFSPHFGMLEIDANCARLTWMSLATEEINAAIYGEYMFVWKWNLIAQRELLQQHQNAISAPGLHASERASRGVEQSAFMFHVFNHFMSQHQTLPCFQLLLVREYCSLLVCALLFYINI